ncbi:hypothetical protein BH23PAT1_BH23PAT1_0390 [soil metagenome]
MAVVSAIMKTEGGVMLQQSSVPRYYIRDSETNELWCFDARLYNGGTLLVK